MSFKQLFSFVIFIFVQIFTIEVFVSNIDIQRFTRILNCFV